MMVAPHTDRMLHRRSFPYRHELVLLALLVAVMIYAWIFDVARGAPDRFVSWPTQLSLSAQLWELALVALPMALIIITAGIDLSVGGTVALCAVVLGKCSLAGLPMRYCLPITACTGLAAGAINGMFVAWVRVHPLIVTLATMAAYRGMAVALSEGRPVSGFPDTLLTIGQEPMLGVTAPGLLVAAAAVVTTVVLAASPLGRSLYAMGFNETAARFSGIATSRIKFLLYTLSGLTAAVAAIIYVARFNTASADLGLQLEFQVITAVVLGGVSIFGGRGTVPGVLLGVLLIHEVQQLVPWQTNRSELNALVIGGLLVGSVLINSLLTRRPQRSG